MIHQPSDLNDGARLSRIESFTKDYGVDPNSVRSLFHAGNVLEPMLKHLYYEYMEQLLNCDIIKEGPELQAQAQLLRRLHDLPEEIRLLEQD
jgi:hypothetical protein